MTTTKTSASAFVRGLRRRLNAQAYEMLCEEIARLDAENEQLRSDLARAEDTAEHWRQQCLEIYHAQADEEDGDVGLTPSGHLVVIPAQRSAA